MDKMNRKLIKIRRLDMRIRVWSYGLLAAWIAVMLGCGGGAVIPLTQSEDFGAYYTKINSGEEFENLSRTGEYADIIVDLGSDNGHFVFWRGSSYLPYWETAEGKWFVEETITRKGDGSGKRPDRVNTYSRVAIIETGPEKVVVHWRYLPVFSPGNPHAGVDQTRFVDEYFTVRATGEVDRTIRVGTEKIDAWRDEKHITQQTFQLTLTGIEGKKTIKPGKPEPVPAVAGSPRKSPAGQPVLWMPFDEGEGDQTVETVSGAMYEIAGHKSLWRKGVSGTALQFDGYNSVIRIPASEGPKPVSGITLEGWVAIGAYPWSWVPIIQQCDDVPEEIERVEGQGALLIGEEGQEEQEGEEDDSYMVVLKKEDETGFFLGMDGYGHPSLKVRVGGEWEELLSDVHLKRRRWYHVAGTYDSETGKMKLYVDGIPAGEMDVAGAPVELSENNIQIGKGKNRRPINPVRMHTFVDSYSFDGLIDEVRIHDRALSDDEIGEVFRSYGPDEEVVNHPEMDQRILPAGRSAGTFGAYYDHLKFYDVWDNLWRFSGHPDVVVEFDELPSKFIFWRGVGYIPMMVNEKGQWYSNEFNETWNRSGGQGCQEPMSDKESYTNHARIIENTPARVVVHWRYPLVDVLHVLANLNEETGWGDWADWYYFIYPDGVAVKKMHLWTHGERDHEWQESMAIFGPDQHPEQIIETRNALTMTNLNGKSVRYHWVDGPPDNVEKPEDKVIQYVNYTGEYDPVTIGIFEGSNVYGGELTPYAVFPTWNHWPVAQMPSDGRYASFPDRTAHSSLTHVFLPTYAEDFGERPYQEKILMEGMLKAGKSELVDLARSWLRAPALQSPMGCTSQDYDQAQRAYLLTANQKSMAFTINGSKRQPVVNPCFVIKNWNSRDPVTMKINGKSVSEGPDFRQGIIRDTNGTRTLIVWIRKTAKSTVRFEIEHG
jgi:hypothetical protein